MTPPACCVLLFRAVGVVDAFWVVGVTDVLLAVDAGVDLVVTGVVVALVGVDDGVVRGVVDVGDEEVGVLGVDVVLDAGVDVGDETLVLVELVLALSELLDPHAVNDMALIAITAEMTLLRIVRSFVVLDKTMTQVTRRWFPMFRGNLSYFGPSDEAVRKLLCRGD